jgi:UPF0716 family protein affecting phage T7 exclusion
VIALVIFFAVCVAGFLILASLGRGAWKDWRAEVRQARAEAAAEHLIRMVRNGSAGL